MKILRATVVLIIFVGMAGLYHLCAQDRVQSAVSPEVRFVVAGIENARQQIRCGQAKVTRYEMTPREYYLLMRLTDPQREIPKGDKDEEKTEIAYWYYQQPRLSMRVEPASAANAPARVIYDRFVSDGVTAKTLSKYDESKQKSVPAPQQNEPEPNSIYYFGFIDDAAVVTKSGLWGQWNQIDPRFYAHYFASKPLDLLFLEKRLGAQYKGEDVVEGSRCMKVEISDKILRTIYWIDTEHSFVVRRLEDYLQVGGKQALSRELQVPRLQESNGIWMPALIESKSYWRLPKIKEEKGKPLPPSGVSPDRVEVSEDYVTLPPKIMRVTISNFRADCNLPPNIFEMEWPIGTQVQDHINQKNFVVELDDDQKKEQNKQDSEKVKSQVQEKPKS